MSDDYDTDVVPDERVRCGTCLAFAFDVPEMPREIPKLGETGDIEVEAPGTRWSCLVPRVGDRVLFVLPNGPCRGQARPSVVAQETDDPVRPVLVVFTLGDDGAQFRDGSVEVRPTGWSPNADPGTWHRQSDRRMRFEHVDVDPMTFRVG